MTNPKPFQFTQFIFPPKCNIQAAICVMHNDVILVILSALSLGSGSNNGNHSWVNFH